MVNRSKHPEQTLHSKKQPGVYLSHSITHWDPGISGNQTQRWSSTFGLQPAVILLYSLVVIVSNILKVSLESFLKAIFYPLIEKPLIGLECQDIVGF